ncbi:uncharacterized protein FOMMEDRAFT_157814 [Fomitiporia mediterranea MF3/22]|uniref:uncharacterized protein n=1 Tax=Fomitiporia mediterranea (strain MF3/22) TaxID=694068 RepID=UPI0004409204|nr:uncharacterized protein FOMMEDRAFT_157814 [Fomitiporia mediterranea MF3/22]EJD00715.1 hypothetical protein FOMMEDRAFT_157814 [Fomitiporia mediterranea MF3/22]
MAAYGLCIWESAPVFLPGLTAEKDGLSIRVSESASESDTRNKDVDYNKSLVIAGRHFPYPHIKAAFQVFGAVSTGEFVKFIVVKYFATLSPSILTSASLSTVDWPRTRTMQLKPPALDSGICVYQFSIVGTFVSSSAHLLTSVVR